MDRSNQASRSPVALLVFVLFASLIGAVRVWQSPARSEAKDRMAPEALVVDLATSAVNCEVTNEAIQVEPQDILFDDQPLVRHEALADVDNLAALSSVPEPLDDDAETNSVPATPSEGLPVAERSAASPLSAAPLPASATPVATMTPSPRGPDAEFDELLPTHERTAARRSINPALIRLLMNDRTDLVVPVELPPALPKRPVALPPGLQDVRVPAPVMASPRLRTWPKPEALSREFQAIEAAHAAEWKEKTLGWLEALQTIPVEDRARLQHALQQLGRLSQMTEPLARSCRVRADEVALRTAGYGLTRRLQLWKATLQATSEATQVRTRSWTERDPQQVMQAALKQALEPLNQSSYKDAWYEFLMIPELSAVAGSQAVFDQPARLAIACPILERMLDDQLSETQRQFLSQPGLRALRSALHMWSTEAVDGPALLHAVERFETDGSTMNAQAVADHWRRLRYSAVPEHRQLAAVIDQHYRNANVRLAATENFLNRLLPAMQSVRQPVREIILGAQVKGQSDSRTQLHVDLLPDDERIKAQLRARGEMQALTQAQKGSVIFRNKNRSHFLIRKLFTLDKDSVRVSRSEGVANARTNLLGLNTQYDTFPIVGSIVRRVALQKHFESKHVARQVFENRVAGKAERRIDAQVDRKLAITKQRLTERVWDPLQEMELDPTPLAMRSTNDRMEMRGRLAADHQLGAFTARPRPVANNMVDLQIHQSAINNFLDQLQLEGREGLLPEVFRGIASDLGFGDITLPEDVPEDVSIRLASCEPIRLDCEENRVKLTLRVARLWDDRLDLRNFEVVAFYVPEINGIQCDLRREGGIQVSCRRRSFAVRSIFTKVLSKNRPIPMVKDELAHDPRMKDLQLTQMVLRDGWVGLSVGKPQPTPQVSSRRGAMR